MTLKSEIMNLISEYLDEMFMPVFKGKCFVVKFNGNVILIEDNMTSALKKMGTHNAYSENCFIHQIGGTRA